MFKLLRIQFLKLIFVNKNNDGGKKVRRKIFINLNLFVIDLSSLPKQFLKDDQQKKYPGKSDADAVQPIYP